VRLPRLPTRVCRVPERTHAHRTDGESMTTRPGVRGTIPDEVKREVEAIVRRFSEEYFTRDDCYYIARYRARHCYLDRSDNGRMRPICRLTYTGTMDGWEFVLYKWTSGIYSPEFRKFAGVDLLDGTIETAMRVGMEAYPTEQTHPRA